MTRYAAKLTSAPTLHILIYLLDRQVQTFIFHDSRPNNTIRHRHCLPQITHLRTNVTTLTAPASTSAKAGKRASALPAPCSKKFAEKTLQQRSDTLHQLEEVFIRIEHAVVQAEMVKVMDVSVSIVKHLNQKIGGVQGVENVFERL